MEGSRPTTAGFWGSLGLRPCAAIAPWARRVLGEFVELALFAWGRGTVTGTQIKEPQECGMNMIRTCMYVYIYIHIYTYIYNVYTCVSLFRLWSYSLLGVHCLGFPLGGGGRDKRRHV